MNMKAEFELLSSTLMVALALMLLPIGCVGRDAPDSTEDVADMARRVIGELWDARDLWQELRELLESGRSFETEPFIGKGALIESAIRRSVGNPLLVGLFESPVSCVVTWSTPADGAEANWLHGESVRLEVFGTVTAVDVERKEIHVDARRIRVTASN